MKLDDLRTLGRSGLPVSPFALGTMTMGNAAWGSPDDVSRAIFDAYVDAGGNLVDTADVYSSGRSEELLGRFVAERGLRDRVVLATKYAFNFDTSGDANAAPSPLHGGSGRKNLHRALEGSLRRLGTDYVDLYWMHVWDGVTPAEEIVGAMGDLVRAGKIRYYGLSDVPAWFATRVATLAQAHGEPAPIAMQMFYSLVERSVEREHVPAAHALGIGMVPWSPLAYGLLTGKYRRDDPKAAESRLSGPNPLRRVALHGGQLAHRRRVARGRGRDGPADEPGRPRLGPEEARGRLGPARRAHDGPADGQPCRAGGRARPRDDGPPRRGDRLRPRPLRALDAGLRPRKRGDLRRGRGSKAEARPHNGPVVLTGLDRLVAEDFARLRGPRLGLLVNQASVDRHYRHALDLMLGAGLDLRALFGPQHGLWGHTQDNMVEWEGGRFRGLALHSLYGAHREPTPAMLEGLDRVVIDVFDVGARYYTFVWSMALTIRACARAGVPVTVLDRPNPINGVDTEGPVLEEGYESFVGRFAGLPIRHGMTAGEIARWLGFDGVEVVEVAGWDRSLYGDETGAPWAMPSPNMPTVDTAVVYPGGCLLEATNLSEGRGTTHPFETFGAPWLDGWRHGGGAARPARLRPTSPWSSSRPSTSTGARSVRAASST